MASAARPRGRSLGTKLVFFSALLTVSAVCLALLLLSVSIRRHTKSLLASTLAHRQRTIVNLQAPGLEQLLRISALMTDSPTLRAAMETYRDESEHPANTRSDLLETIQVEVERVAAGLGRDLFVVTDHTGRVLASSGDPEAKIRAGEMLGSHPIIRRALELDAPVSEANLSVMEIGGEHFRVGSVPIVLQGFAIGTLTIGDHIDHRFAQKLRQSFDCDFVVFAGGHVVGSTLGAEVPLADLARLAGSIAQGTGATRVVTLAGAEFVAAGLSLGADEQGDEVELYLLNSLSAALGEWSRSMSLLVAAWGLLAVLLAGVAAWKMSRSVLRPLWDFVGFMRAVATSGDHARRFHCNSACVEVETLNDTYNQLMDSLLEHERRLLQRAKEDLDRLERLKESEKLASLGRMLSGAAHEINNPLTGVFGNVELLLRDGGLDPPTRARIEKIRQESQRVVALVRNLLKTSHRDTGERAVVDVLAVLREAAEVRRHDFTCAGMRLDLEPGAGPIRVLGSELELHQVFLNIINNSFDALQEGAGSGRRLGIRSEAVGGRAVLTFADNGPGMKNPRQVFEHFYTTKGIGKGTGLGLSICHTIVQQHGGEISAENGEAGGARFIVSLPLAARDAATGVAPPAVAIAPVETDSAPLAASVLIVDDEPTIVDLQKEILGALGAAVVGVGSGGEAIEQLRARPFDIIVTDLKMPGSVSGMELYRWVESNLPQATRGFVFVTGDTAGGENRDFIESTGARFLAKPFSMREYVRTLREIHEHRISPP